MPGQPLAAILADTFISGVNVIATKTNVSLRNSVIADQQNHSGDADHAIHEPDGFIVARDRKITPAIKVERLILLVNRLRNSLIKQNKGTANRGYMDRKIGAVKD